MRASIGGRAAVATAICALACAGCTSPDGSDTVQVSELNRPPPVSDPCGYDDYERVIRGFANAVSEGDVAAAERLMDAFDGRFMIAQGNHTEAEQELDARGFVAFGDEHLGGEMRLQRAWINDSRGGSGDEPEREFAASIRGFDGIARGDVECVNGEAWLGQWLLIEIDPPDDWPCDPTRGACYVYD